MSLKLPVILIFDVGKTNKKLLLFDEDYKIVYEQTVQLKEIEDEDGFPCEDVFALTNWIKTSFDRITNDERFDVKAVNFSAYGASFVYLDERAAVMPPLYNYLKPYPQPLLQNFYDTYGGQSKFSKATASPVLGNLNSGMQLYRLKWEKPGVFQKIKYALHLPQYLSFILNSSLHSDITSIGCHTNLWNFDQNTYHEWVDTEGMRQKLPDIFPCNAIVNDRVPVGGGLHDSSAALIPYLLSFQEPFVLLSTGTWCISLNPFNHSLLSDDELRQDCLCYLSYDANPVKASRLFAGHEHEQQVKRLAAHFAVDITRYKEAKVDFDLLRRLKGENSTNSFQQGALVGPSEFVRRDLTPFKDYDAAYHQLIADIVQQQVRSTNLVLKGTPVSRIFVDGGFSNNSIYMHMLADAFPNVQVFAASVSQASAVGAALVIHQHWNSKELPAEIIKVKSYSIPHQLSG
ncbi:MAG: carbohydrate kinase [Bacteroidetes bacterium]|nr:MAG: carbohydrate kinase [Bacteroidota bacterium]